MPRFGLYCVADGMSGVWGGDIASSTAVASLRTAFETELVAAEAMHLNERTRLAERAINAASRMIMQKAEELHYQGMGTTIVAILFDMVRPSRAMCLHAGDSRAYRFREGVLSLLTRDHTVATAAGIEDESQMPAVFHGVITRAVGVEDSVQIDRTPIDVRPDDLFLLCSDGLNKMIPDARIGQICEELKLEPLNTLAHALILAALDAGGEDNVTATVIRVAKPLPKEPVFDLPEAPDPGANFIPAMKALADKTITPTPTPDSSDTGDLAENVAATFIRTSTLDAKENARDTPGPAKKAISLRLRILVGLFALVTAIGIAIFPGWLPGRTTFPAAAKTSLPIALPAKSNAAQTQTTQRFPQPAHVALTEPAANPSTIAPTTGMTLRLDALFGSGEWGDSADRLEKRLPAAEWQAFSPAISNWVSLWTWARTASPASLNTNYYECEAAARTLLQSVDLSLALSSPGRWPILPDERANAFCRARHQMQLAVGNTLIKLTEGHFCRSGPEANPRAMLFRDIFRMTFQKDTESVLETLNDLARATDDLDRIRDRMQTLQTSNAPLFSQGPDPELFAAVEDLNIRTDHIVEMLYRTAHVLPQAMAARGASSVAPTQIEASILEMRSQIISSRVPFGADVRAWRNAGATIALEKLMTSVQALLATH